MKKKLVALILTFTMALSLTACGSDDASSDNTGGGDKSGSGDGKVAFTIFNSKSELQEYLEDAAAKYGEENDVDIEVYYSNDTVAAHLSVKYAQNEPYTLSMTDAKDVYLLGAEHGYDMKDQDWVDKTDYAITVNDKVLGFPVCIEARGLLYNADAIKETTGEDFDPASIKTLDDFSAFCEKLVAGGMEAPTAILKPDWSLGAHYFQQVYEERDDVEGFVASLLDGKADLANDEKFNSLMDTFDVLMKYNAFASGPISAEDEQVHQKMSEGAIAFQFGGCWDWVDIMDFEYTGKVDGNTGVGIMPVPQSAQDDYADCLVGGGSKFFYIDNSEFTTDEQRAAACDFLNWLVDSKDGQTLISDTCGMVSPFSNNEVTCSNGLGQIVKKYADEGKLVPNYDYDPDDHYSKVGAYMQEYLAGQADREKLAKNIETYWSTATPIEH